MSHVYTLLFYVFMCTFIWSNERHFEKHSMFCWALKSDNCQHFISKRSQKYFVVACVFLDKGLAQSVEHRVFGIQGSYKGKTFGSLLGRKSVFARNATRRSAHLCSVVPYSRPMWGSSQLHAEYRCCCRWTLARRLGELTIVAKWQSCGKRCSTKPNTTKIID